MSTATPLRTVPSFLACLLSTLLSLYEQNQPWSRVDLVIKDKVGAFWVTESVEVSLSVGEDASLPRDAYTSAARVGLQPFVAAGRVALVLLFFSFAASSLSVGTSVLRYVQKGTLAYKSQLLSLIVATALHFFAVVLYLILTVGQLGTGGYYLRGLHVALVNVVIGICCVVVSFLADAITKLEAVVMFNRQRGLDGRGGSLYGATMSTSMTTAGATASSRSTAPYSPVSVDSLAVELGNPMPPPPPPPVPPSQVVPDAARTATVSPSKIPKRIPRL